MSWQRGCVIVVRDECLVISVIYDVKFVLNVLLLPTATLIRIRIDVQMQQIITITDDDVIVGLVRVHVRCDGFNPITPLILLYLFLIILLYPRKHL